MENKLELDIEQLPEGLYRATCPHHKERVAIALSISEVIQKFLMLEYDQIKDAVA